MICVDKKSFVALAPPFGRLKDIYCCKNGINGKFVEKPLILNASISIGPQDKEMTVEEFVKFCEAYKDRNFPVEENVIAFPPLSLIDDPELMRIAKTFLNFLSFRHGLRAVIWNTDDNKYLQSVLSLPESCKMEQRFLNRLNVFDSSSSVLNIRIVENTSDTVQELENIAYDLMNLSSTYKHLKPSCYIIGLLCFPTTSRFEVEEQMKFFCSNSCWKYMNVCFLAKEDLQTSQALEDWWNNVLEIELNRLESIYQCSRKSPERQNNVLNTILAQTVATIAMTNVFVCPTLLADPFLQLKTLFLNPSQVEAIYSQSKRKLVLGNYGSGKSIVGDEIFKKLYQKPRSQPKKLIYVVWEKYSLLEVYKLFLLEKLREENSTNTQEFVVEVGNPYTLSGDKEVTLLQFLTHQLENSISADIIIDELPSEEVHQTDVAKLKEIFKNHPQSSIVIIPQSVIIERTASKGGQEPMSIGRNCLKMLELEVFELSEIMRNTVEICAVMKKCQNVVQSRESILNISESNDDSIDTKHTKSIDTGNIETGNISTNYNINTNISEPTTLTVMVDQFSDRNRGSENITNVNVDEPISIDVDKCSTYLHNPDQQDRNSSIQLSSTFKFFKVINGNKVTDRRPIILNLPTEFNLEKELSAKILYLVLQKMCHLNSKSPSTLLIGSNIEEIRMLSYALGFIERFKYETFFPQLQGRVPSIDEKRSIVSKFMSGSSILSDNSSVKGLECKSVVLFIRRNEHFQRHLFIETLARASVECYIITYNVHMLPSQEATIGQVFEEVSAKGLLEEVTVTTYKDWVNSRTSYRIEDKTFSVNEVYCEDMECQTTIDNYFKKFQTEFRMDLSPLDYRYQILFY